MKTGTKFILALLAIGGVGAVAYSVVGGERNLHIYRTLKEYMESDELPVGSKMVIVGYHPDHPQAPTVETLLAEMAGRYGDIHFVGLPRDVAIDSVGMEFIGSGWGGVAAAGDVQTFESSWEGPEDRDDLRNDFLAAVGAASAVDQPTEPAPSPAVGALDEAPAEEPKKAGLAS